MSNHHLRKALSVSDLMSFENAYAVLLKNQKFSYSLLEHLPAHSLSDLQTIIPAIDSTGLGPDKFCKQFSVNLPIMAGSMANEIASVNLVSNMAEHGLLASYGTAGLSHARMLRGIQAIKHKVHDKPFACCLIHHPLALEFEMKTVELFLENDIHIIEASAFMGITPAIVLYKAKGFRIQAGVLVNQNQLIAKISRPEIAKKFLLPPESALVSSLLDKQLITQQEAQWLSQHPLCDAITVEADSGGHTDNRPAQVIVPAIALLRDQICKERQYQQWPLVGQAGGIGHPQAILSAYRLGAEYVVTGSINQATKEAGTSDAVKAILSSCEYYDVSMAPAGDMFEQGVEVQVLKKGTLYVPKSKFLREVYNSYDSLEVIPSKILTKLTHWIFQKPFDEVWQETIAFHKAHQLENHIERALKNPKYKMALIFKWYLGQTSHWATTCEPGREADFQVWCGPAMGGFNAWVADSGLAAWHNRSVGDINKKLYEAAIFYHRKQAAELVGVVFSKDVRYPLPKQTKINDLQQKSESKHEKLCAN